MESVNLKLDKILSYIIRCSSVNVPIEIKLALTKYPSKYQLCLFQISHILKNNNNCNEIETTTMFDNDLIKLLLYVVKYSEINANFNKDANNLFRWEFNFFFLFVCFSFVVSILFLFLFTEFRNCKIHRSKKKK